MRVLAAKFPDRERASAALASLQNKLDGGLQADIAPLAGDSEPSRSETVLAGHFSEDQTGAVADIVTASGGEIVADVDEAWTRPRFAPTGDGRTGFSW